MMVDSHSAFVHPADLAPIGKGDLGYARQTVSFCVVIGPAGRCVAVENLVGYGSVGGTGMRMMLPEDQRQKDRALVNFLWDRHRHSPVAVEPRYRARWRGSECARLEAYGAFHRSVLEGVTDTPLVAFLRFLDDWAPDSAAQTLGGQARGDNNFVFRFQYDDEFLHERHAARLAWLRQLSPVHG